MTRGKTWNQANGKAPSGPGEKHTIPGAPRPGTPTCLRTPNMIGGGAAGSAGKRLSSGASGTFCAGRVPDNAPCALGIDSAWSKPCVVARRDPRDGRWLLARLGYEDREAFVRYFGTARSAGARVAVLEDTFHGPNVQTFKQLCNVQGRIQAYCAEAGLPCVLVPAARWKPAMLTVGGHFPRNRAEQKAQAIWTVSMEHGVNCGKDDDIADAVLLAEYGRLMRLWEGEAE